MSVKHDFLPDARSVYKQESVYYLWQYTTEKTKNQRKKQTKKQTKKQQ